MNNVVGRHECIKEPLSLSGALRFIFLFFAVCPGGEEAVSKTVGRKRLAGSNPVYGVVD